MKKIAHLLILTLSGFALTAQTGVKGKITNKDNEAVAFAFITVIGQPSLGTQSGFDGNYSLTMKRAGRYDLVFASDVGTDTVKGVVVLAGAMTTLNHKYKDSAVEEVEEVVVDNGSKERTEEATQAQTIEEVKNAEEVKNVIGTQEAEKKGASDVEQAAKKVVGVSSVGSGYIFVRGMGDRYNNASLNGLPIVSPDPDKKVIPLNLFSTGVTKSISVAKTFSPSAYGDFSGGLVDIRTKEYPENHFFKFSLSQGLNTQSFLKEFISSQKESNDFFGFGNSARALSATLKLDENDGMNTADGNFPNNPFTTKFNPLTSTAYTNGGVGFTYGNKIVIKADKDKIDSDKHTIGYLLNTSFGNGYGYNDAKFRFVNKQGINLIDFDIQNYDYTTTSNILGNLHYDFNNKINIDYTYLFINLSQDQTKIVQGEHFDFDNDSLIFTRRYTYRQNTLNVHQLRGSFLLGNKDRLEIEWGGAFSQVANVEPDRRQLVYFVNNVGGNTIYDFNIQDRRESHRFYSELYENEYSGMLGAKYHLRYTAKGKDTLSTWNISAGAQYKNKSRNFEFWLYSYYLNDVNAAENSNLNVNTPDAYISDANYAANLFSLKDDAGVEAPHWANQQILSYYLNTSYDIIPFKLKVIGGARIEDSYQDIIFKPQSSSPYLPNDTNVLSGINVLPTISFRYDANDKNVFRLAGSQTVSRPGFRELAPFEYTEVFAGIVNVGNPDLKNGTNYNLDVKYEHYPKKGESFSITGFYKQLIDPIEQTFIANPSGQKQTFQNTAGATVAGAEFELNKSLNFIDGGMDTATGLPTGVGRFFSVGLNMAYIYSQVEFDTSAAGASLIATNLERPLQGASPFLANASLSFNKGFGADSTGAFKYKASMTVSYNVFAKRLYSAGIQGIGDAYQMPVNTLNFVAKLERGNWSYKFKVLNILNPKYTILQDPPSDIAGRDPEILSEFRRGVSIGAGISYKFNIKKKEVASEKNN